MIKLFKKLYHKFSTDKLVVKCLNKTSSFPFIISRAASKEEKRRTEATE